MTANPVDQLTTALGATENVIAAVRDDQWDGATPCPEWNVRQLVAHITAGNRLFARVLQGEPASPPPPAGSVGDAELLGAYRESSRTLVAAFGRPGVMQGVFTVPFGTVPGAVAVHLRITEALVHGWDVAHATGQAADFPADIAEQELAFTRDKLGDIPPDRTPFAPPQPVADDAPAIDRLAACLGRTVTTA